MANEIVEEYDGSLDGYFSVRGQYYVGQTFTASESYDIVSVKFKMYRGASDPGVVTCDLFAESGGLPTGSVLATGTIAGTTVPEDVGNVAWVEIVFGTPYSLSSGTAYALSVKGASASISLKVGYDSTSPSYAGGQYVYSLNSGSTWQTLTRDLPFQTYKSGSTYVDGAVDMELDLGVIVAGSTSGFVDGAVDVELDVSVTPTAVLRTTVSGSSLVDNKRIVAVGNNQLWYEDI